MDIFIITPVNGGRHLPLVKQLSEIGEHEVCLVDAVMLRALPPSFDVRRSRSVMGRSLTPGEVGCATSHRRAWEHFLEGKDEWACVMEDDALVANSDLLRAVLTEIESRRVQGAEVISLFTVGAVLSQIPLTSWTRCRFEPPFTVAYVLNRVAARAMLIANSDSAQVADWPRASGVAFYLASGHVVSHGDDTTVSLIGSERGELRGHTGVGSVVSASRKVVQRIALYSLVHYLLNRRHFESPVHYYRIVLRHRILWHIGFFGSQREFVSRVQSGRPA